MPAANAETMSLHLAAISRRSRLAPMPLSSSTAPAITLHAALASRDNITLINLPPYAPELNPIENVWEYLRGNKLAITVFDEL